jgi:microcompartment protein CcmL/EutN
MIFLDAVSAVGKSITSAVISNPNNPLEKSLVSLSQSSINDENVADNNQSMSRAEERRKKEVQTVSEEAQILRKIFIKVNEQKTA